jgi:glutaminase
LIHAPAKKDGNGFMSLDGKMNHTFSCIEFDDAFASFLQHLYEKYLPLTKGRTTDILPQLQAADPNTFAISAVSVEGNVCCVGDFEKPFSIQSISKPFVYGLALEDHGAKPMCAAKSVWSPPEMRSTP